MTDTDLIAVASGLIIGLAAIAAIEARLGIRVMGGRSMDCHVAAGDD
jgi:hypothetical protein